MDKKCKDKKCKDKKCQKRTEQMKNENEELKQRLLAVDILPPVKYSLDGVVWNTVTKYSELQIGDHVAYKDSYWKHAIIEDLPGDQRVSIIRWKLRPLEIIRDNLDMKLGSGYQLQRANYTKGCYENELVVKRAMARIGETDYGIITNFARAFPEWCKTGRGRLTHSDKDADNRYMAVILEQRKEDAQATQPDSE